MNKKIKHSEIFENTIIKRYFAIQFKKALKSGSA
jgi:hypothetical protein